MRKYLCASIFMILSGATLFADASQQKTDSVSGASDSGYTSTTDVDTFTTASITNYYEASSWTGETLMDAISSRTGAWTIATVNPDGSPNIAVAVFGVLDEDTLLLNLAPNQTAANITRTGEAMAIIYKYTADLEVDRSTRNQGAKLILETVSPEKHKSYQDTDSVTPNSFIFTIKEVRPLG